MNNNYLIIDNFLSNIQFQIIYNALCQKGRNFRWVLSNDIVGTNDLDGYEKDNYMFNHQFFIDKPFFISEEISLIVPILQQLHISELIRAKSNFYPRTERIQKHNWHVDRDDEHYSAIYYVNTNNGKTIIKDIAEIESIENRIVIFKGDLLHASTTSSDSNRVNINFNFRSDYNLGNIDSNKKESKFSYS